MENNRLRNAVEFLMFSYFGIDFGGESEDIVDAAVKKAYTDATNQGAYNALKKKLVNGDEYKNDDEYKNASKAVLIAQIAKLKNKNPPYSAWHKETCNNLCDRFKNVIYKDKDQDKDVRAFTYGNAQKWVNMTMKYLYILYEIFKEYKKDCAFVDDNKWIEHYYKEFQVPVDSYIIEAVWNQNAVDVPIATKHNFRDEEYKDSRAKAWSKWDEDEYDKFRDSVSTAFGKEETSLEWEHKAWIDIAKKRKQKK